MLGWAALKPQASQASWALPARPKHGSKRRRLEQHHRMRSAAHSYHALTEASQHGGSGLFEKVLLRLRQVVISRQTRLQGILPIVYKDGQPP